MSTTPYTPRVRSKDKEPPQDREPVQVFCRIRPVDSDIYCVQRVNDSTIKIADPRNPARPAKFYSFKYVFEGVADQRDVFDEVAFPLVKDALHGKDGLLFTYGMTSSGKSYTMSGTPDQPGILPRTLDVIFNSLQDSQARPRSFKFNSMINQFRIQPAHDAVLEWQEEQKRRLRATPATPYGVSRTRSLSRRRGANERNQEPDMDWKEREKTPTFVELENPNQMFTIFISYVEIYNNYVYDLLDDEAMDMMKIHRQPQSKSLQEDTRSKKVFVAQVKEMEVHSAEEAFEFFEKGQKRRKVALTSLNAESSRSHSVFNIRIVQAPKSGDGIELVSDDRSISVSQLSLVDLAGSERQNRTGAVGDRFREAGEINKSLMILRQCMEALRTNQRSGKSSSMVPYRNSKITHLFKSYFEGEGTVKMVICVNPEPENYDETLQVMKFAETAQEVTTVRPNELPPLYPLASLTAELPRIDLGGLITLIGPPLPHRFIEGPNDVGIAQEYMDILEARKKSFDYKLSQLREADAHFRSRLVNQEQESMMLKMQLQQKQSELDARNRMSREVDTKVAEYQRIIDQLQQEKMELDRRCRQMQVDLDQQELQINQTEGNCQRLKQKARDKIREEKEKMRRHFEQQLNEKIAQLEQQIGLSKEKMHLLRQILDADSPDWAFLREFPSVPPSTQQHSLYQGFNLQQEGTSRVLPSAPPASHITPGNSGRGTQHATAASCPHVSTRRRSRRDEFLDHAFSPLSHHQDDDATTTATGGMCDEVIVSPSSHAPPVINPRHRRSLSTGGEKWIDHRPKGTLDLGTVLKPKIKNSKSVTKLKSRDVLNKDATKYSLVHHEANVDGDVTTHVYKGDVISSVSGGAQIIFNDVEVLRQTSPPGRKRAVSDSMAQISSPPPTDITELNLPAAPEKRSRR